MHSIGLRLKAWRDWKKLSQKDAAAHFGVPSRTYQDYERDLKAPGAGAIESFIRAGLNANWLLTGEGEMLVQEVRYEPMTSTELIAASPKANHSAEINIDALTQAVNVMLKTAPEGETLEQTVRKAVLFYQYCIDIERITPTGEGKGNDDNVV